jgi:hypothetical protein
MICCVAADHVYILFIEYGLKELASTTLGDIFHSHALKVNYDFIFFNLITFLLSQHTLFSRKESFINYFSIFQLSKFYNDFS